MRGITMKTICFFGDSITRRGYWVAEIYAHLKKDGYIVYNCGVSGDSATAAISRLYSDCLSRTPDTVVMMFGMNDIGRALYDETAVNPEQKREERLAKYRASIRTLTESIMSLGISVVLCTPTPYNDVTPSNHVPCSANDGLAACAEFVRALAEEKGLPCVDFFRYLRPMVGSGYQTLPDLVHPTPESHHPMAQCFLKTLGFIDEIDDTPFLPMDDAAQARFDAEQRLRELYFIEWNLMYSERMRRQMTHADFLALAESRLRDAEAQKDATKIRWYKYYLHQIEKKPQY